MISCEIIPAVESVLGLVSQSAFKITVEVLELGDKSIFPHKIMSELSPVSPRSNYPFENNNKV